MWSPCRVESVSVLYRNEGSYYTFLVFGRSLRDEVTLTGRAFLDLDRASSLAFGAKPSRWGHPSRVVLRISAHSVGMKASSVHLSFVASLWGHPMGRVWFSSHSIETKSSLYSWSVFLQDGVTLFGSDSTDLISIDGITTVGLLGAFFRPVLGVSFCHPWVGRSALKSGRVPHSVVFTSGADSVCIPLANEGVGLGPSSPSGPVASRPPLAGRSASVV